MFAIPSGIIEKLELGENEMNILPVVGMGGLRILQANFTKRASVHTGKFDSMVHFGAFFNGSAAVISFFYLLGAGFSGLNTLCVLCAFLIGAGFLAEQFTNILALRRAPLVLCNLCALGGGTVLASIAGIFFFEEPMSLLQWVGVVMFFVAVFLLSPKPEKKENAPKASVWILFPILAANTIINGLLLILIKYYADFSENTNSILFTFFCYVFAAIMFGAIALGLRTRPAFAERKGKVFPKPLYINGGALGLICASICSLQTTLSTIIPIVILNTVPSVISVIGCAVIDAIFFKTKLTWRNILGVICGIACAILIVKL